jgi:CBS domain-containing protein
MTIKDLMTEQAELIGRQATVREAARRMKQLNVGALPVKDDGKVVGIITDRDIVTRVLAADRDPAATVVGDAMTDHVAACSEDDSLDQAAQIMREKKVRRLVVTSSSGKLRGMVSLGDLAAKSGEERLTAVTAKAVSEPATPSR